MVSKSSPDNKCENAMKECFGEPLYVEDLIRRP